MIKGTGIDIVKIERMQKAILKENFVRRVFSTSEQEYCISKNKQAAYSYAARFAAKEALAKALGTGIRGVMGFQAASVLSDELGKPCVHTHGELTKMFESQGLCAHISLSDEAGLVLAYCVVEKIG